MPYEFKGEKTELGTIDFRAASEFFRLIHRRACQNLWSLKLVKVESVMRESVARCRFEAWEEVVEP